MSFLSFSSKTFFELSQIYCLRIDFAFVWDFYIPHTFSETLFSFQGTTVVSWQLLYYIMSFKFWQELFLIFSSLSNDSFIILSSFARFGKLFLNFFDKNRSLVDSIGSGCQTRTDDNLINSQVLYQLSYAGIMRGNVLSSQGAIPQLLSACWSLTSVFGMGTGVSFKPSSPHSLSLRTRACALKTKSYLFLPTQ